MKLTQKKRIFPTKEQEETLWILSEKCRLIYNFALTERIDSWKNKGKYVSYFKQQNDLPIIKEKYPEYRWVYSKVLQYILRTLDADYRSFFSLLKKGDKNARPPKFKGKKYFTAMVYNQSGFKFKDGNVFLSQKYNKTLLKFKISDKFKFSKVYQVSVFKKEGKFFICVTYDRQVKDYVDNNKYQAFDLGIMKHTGVNLDGRFIEFKNSRVDKYWQKRVQEIQSRRDHCIKGSNKYNKLNKNLIRMKRKCANQMKDFQHKLSKKIIDNTKANTIIIGDLAVKDMSKKKKGKSNHKGTKGLNRAIQNTGTLGRFVRFLTYKAELIGKRVIEINEKDTSKQCYVCGKKHEMPLYKRIIKCDCGNEIDRDKNSAINIMSRFLSQNAKWTGYQQFVGNLRKTGLPVEDRYSQEAPCVSWG
ncbi:MAG: transposase [Actinobacteria bacterium]|nr:transposase [Actinomycetota bacterium]